MKQLDDILAYLRSQEKRAAENSRHEEHRMFYRLVQKAEDVEARLRSLERRLLTK